MHSPFSRYILSFMDCLPWTLNMHITSNNRVICWFFVCLLLLLLFSSCSSWIFAFKLGANLPVFSIKKLHSGRWNRCVIPLLVLLCVCVCRRTKTNCIWTRYSQRHTTLLHSELSVDWLQSAILRSESYHTQLAYSNNIVISIDAWHSQPMNEWASRFFRNARWINAAN